VLFWCGGGWSYETGCGLLYGNSCFSSMLAVVQFCNVCGMMSSVNSQTVTGNGTRGQLPALPCDTICDFTKTALCQASILVLFLRDFPVPSCGCSLLCRCRCRWRSQLSFPIAVRLFVHHVPKFQGPPCGNAEANARALFLRLRWRFV